MKTHAQRLTGWVRGYYAESWWTSRPSPLGLALYVIAVVVVVVAVRLVLDAVGASPTNPWGMVVFVAVLLIVGSFIIRWDVRRQRRPG